MRFYLYHFDARVKILEPRCACTEVVLWLYGPPRYEQKSELSTSPYANMGQNCESTNTEQTVRRLLTLASFDSIIIEEVPSGRNLLNGSEVFFTWQVFEKRYHALY